MVSGPHRQRYLLDQFAQDGSNLQPGPCGALKTGAPLAEINPATLYGGRAARHTDDAVVDAATRAWKGRWRVGAT